MTNDEVLKRADDMNALLGKTYGRLQNELLAPIVTSYFKLLNDCKHTEGAGDEH